MHVKRITLANFEAESLNLLHALQRASLVSIDCEFSGLGLSHYNKDSNVSVRDGNIERRYEALREVVGEYALLSIGLTIVYSPSLASYFLRDADPNDTSFEFDFMDVLSSAEIECWEIWTRRDDSFRMDASSMQFLVSNGFDMSAHITQAIPYPNPFLKDIFSSITSTSTCRKSGQKLVVMHNGFLDLMYLYDSLYNRLPRRLDTFISDVSSLFPSLVDTKYVSDYVYREPVSFLAYLFHKYQQSADVNGDRKLFELVKKRVESVKLPSETVTPTTDCIEEVDEIVELGVKDVCEQFAYHGHCQDRPCPKSHNIDLILLFHQQRALEPAAKRARTTSDKPKKKFVVKNSNVDATTVLEVKSEEVGKGHAAWMDSYMTLLTFLYQLKNYRDGDALREWVGRVYLIGKNVPLLLRKSPMVAYSKFHQKQLSNESTKVINDET